MSVAETIGVVLFVSRTGERTGCVDVCRQENGNVLVRVNRRGTEIVMAWRPDEAREIAALIAKASAPAIEGGADATS